MKLYDTLTGSITPVRPGPIGIYLCGVTVYDDTHIGHARTVIVFDILKRFLNYMKQDVKLVQNFTDIDDKIINRAHTEGEDPLQLAERYIAKYHEDFDRLNVMRADEYPRATTHIDDIISMTSKLLQSGHAYTVSSGVYYSVKSFPRYGRLSGKKTDEMMAGVRIEPQEDKRSPLDFALWKNTRTGPVWDSPWGPGRPGWHIECSAMSLKCLGEDFEIHGGGRDLIFPHHENEMAQSEGQTGQRQAHIWMHTGMVTINGQKMSKSLGNIKSTRALLDRWGPNVLRLFCISSHYSKPVDYSDDMLVESLALWRRLEACWYTLEQACGDITGIALDYMNRFDDAMAADLNMHEAVSVATGMAKDVGEMATAGTLHISLAADMLGALKHMMDILGLYVAPFPDNIPIHDYIMQRNKLRQAGLYKEADSIRDRLRTESVELLDYKGGTVWVYRETVQGDCT